MQYSFFLIYNEGLTKQNTSRFNIPSQVCLQFPAGTFPTASHRIITHAACVSGFH